MEQMDVRIQGNMSEEGEKEGKQKTNHIQTEGRIAYLLYLFSLPVDQTP